ncbi:MAG: poly-gamma-glutamate synthase PgsB/CapB [Cognaticolwellia sp.]|jgi:poly-gamma-glutamate synthase PgsB/CapB
MTTESGGLRPRPGPSTGAGKALAKWLPPLMARIRADGVDSLAMRLEADMGANLPSVPDVGFSRVLSVVGEQLMDTRRGLLKSRSELMVAAQRAKGSGELRSVLQHFLRTTVKDERELSKDLRALGRNLDAAALAERLDARVNAVGIELEILCLILAHHPLRGPASSLLDGLIQDGRAQTRRAAVGTLATWISRVLFLSKDLDGAIVEVDDALVQRVLDLVHHPDPLTGRRSLVVLAGLPVPRALSELRALTDRNAERPVDFLLRAAATRLMVEVSPEAARDAYMMARVDPSETVRCALVDALGETSTPGARALIQRLRVDDPALSVRTRASIALRTHAKPAPVSEVVERVGRLRYGQQDTLTLPAGLSPLKLAEDLLPLVDTDHGFGIETLDARRVRVHRGQSRVLRAWRVLLELRRGDPGKRQYGDHLSGGYYPGAIVVPPAAMADVSPTEVPGRPVLSGQWGSWGPWLPLPDLCVDALWEGDKTLLTRQGRTHLQAPTGLWPRVRAGWSLAWDFRRFAGLREQALAGKDLSARRVYSESLEALGFKLDFVPSPTVDARLPEMFPPPRRELLLGAPLAAGAVLDGVFDLMSQRSLQPMDLVFLSAGIGGVFFGRLVVNQQRTRRARAAIPLVIGGWGTRGKSGVARLKAALFEGLGYDTVCKTTGCEAMVMRSFAGRPATEFFLFRPYDRATIWEHADLLQQAAAMKAEVFIWECMALRPSYVEQLQLHWTRDDVSTITNTYPDHEDIQGPTGQDVAEVISSFVPESALVLTTEQQMTPILRDRAAERGSQLLEVSAAEIDTLPADLLARLPYQEHPANVTLVRQLAEELGIDPEEAVVLMADHVVPDLGSLATFPELRIRGRRVEFTNGSSANERTGFLNNWRRSGFEGHDPERDAQDVLVLVLNNRYDRVARSQVFAEILVQDATAHRMVLIGTNLEGLQAYIDEALDSAMPSMEVYGGGPDLVSARLSSLQRRLRIVEVPALLRATQSQLGLDLEPCARHFEDLLDLLPAELLTQEQAEVLLEDWVKDLKQCLANLAPAFDTSGLAAAAFYDAVDQERGLVGAMDPWLGFACEQLRFAALVRVWETLPDRSTATEILQMEVATGSLFQEIFLGRLVVVQDSGASGDQIIDAIAKSTPLGSRARVLSAQNIKGTGLDLVYRFFHARLPMEWAAELRSGEAALRSKALEQLKGWHQWSLPLVHELLRILSFMQQGGGVTDLQKSLGVELERRRGLLDQAGTSSGERGPLASLIDPLLSIARRWESDRLMDDLASGRISAARAEHNLRRLTYEQRGDQIEDAGAIGPGLLS